MLKLLSFNSVIISQKFQSHTMYRTIDNREDTPYPVLNLLFIYTCKHSDPTWHSPFYDRGKHVTSNVGVHKPINFLYNKFKIFHPQIFHMIDTSIKVHTFFNNNIYD